MSSGTVLQNRKEAMYERWVVSSNGNGDRVIGGPGVPESMAVAMSRISSRLGLSHPISRTFSQLADSTRPKAPNVVSAAVPSSGKIGGEEQCAVCLECYKEGDDCALLPCTHVFHWTCAHLWFRKKLACPLCRTPI